MTRVEQKQVTQFLKHLLHTSKDKQFISEGKHAVATASIRWAVLLLLSTTDQVPSGVFCVENPYIVVLDAVGPLASEYVHLCFHNYSTMSSSWCWCDIRFHFFGLPCIVVDVELEVEFPLKEFKSISFLDNNLYIL